MHIPSIAITIDNKYVQHACVMLESLKRTTKREIAVYCIYNDVPDERLQILQKHFKNSRLKLMFRKIQASDLTFLPIRERDHVSIATYFRIFIPDILPELDDVLFLDCDIIIKEDISYLLDLKLDELAVAAAPELGFSTHLEKKQELGIPAEKNYFNAGILKMNLAYFRENRLSQTIVSFIQEFPQKCVFWDQDALNGVIKGDFFPLDIKYNMVTGYFMSDSFNQLEVVKKAAEQVVIVHFTGAGKDKPWFYENRNPYKFLYYKYLKLTPFYDFWEQDRPMTNDLTRRIVRKWDLLLNWIILKLSYLS